VFVLLFVLGILPRATVTAQASPTPDTITVGAVVREYFVYRTPAVDTSRPSPLLLVFHGGGGSAQGAMARYGFSGAAGASGAYVVYPQGLNGHWSDGRGIFTAGDDVAFTTALVARLRTRLRIDPRRIYAVGHSNGAIFVNSLACRVPGVFAAIGAMAGTIPLNDVALCRSAAPISVIEIHGTADPLTLYAGGTIGLARGAISGAEASIAEWAAVDGCKSPPTRTPLPPIIATDSTRVVQLAFSGCRDARGVVLYAIQGAGHNWPGGALPMPESAVGPSTQQLDATRVIWDFFMVHPAPKDAVAVP